MLLLLLAAVFLCRACDETVHANRVSGTSRLVYHSGDMGTHGTVRIHAMPGMMYVLYVRRRSPPGTFEFLHSSALCGHTGKSRLLHQTW